jgi:hypothetical protein
MKSTQFSWVKLLICMLALMIYGAVMLFIDHLWAPMLRFCNWLDMQSDAFWVLLILAAVAVMVVGEAKRRCQ